MLGGVRFTLQYAGSVEGTWRTTYTKNDISSYKCGGYDNWGTFKSSVRPGSRPLTVVVATDLGGRSVYLDWSRSSLPKGVVTYARAAEGWRLDYQSGACVQVPDTSNTNCGARTFPGQVALAKDSKLLRNAQNAFLSWEREPVGARQGCLAGEKVPDEEDAKTRLDLWKLYQCGVRKPRGCRFTVRGGATDSKSISQTMSDGVTKHTWSSRLQWSVTFVARGR
jgi:hypothetical protein